MSSVGGCNWHDSKQTWRDWSCLRSNTEQTFQSEVCDAKQKPHSGWSAGTSEFISGVIKQASAHVNTSSQASKETTAKWVMIRNFFPSVATCGQQKAIVVWPTCWCGQPMNVCNDRKQERFQHFLSLMIIILNISLINRKWYESYPAPNA